MSARRPADGGVWRAIAATIAFAAVLAVWLVGLFRQGLFYPMAALVAGGLCALLTAAALLLARPRLGPRRLDLVDGGVALLVAMYAVSLVDAVRPDRAALQIVLLVAGLCVYAAVRAGAFGPARRVRALVRATVVLGAVAVTLAGLGAAVGRLHLVFATTDNMLASTFQYHNSYAALALVGLVLALSGQDPARPRRTTVALGVGGAWLGMGIALSQSRGVWLVAPVILTLWLGFLPGRSRARALLLTLAALLGAAVGTPLGLGAIERVSLHRLVLALVLSGAVAAVLTFAVAALYRRRAVWGRRLAQAACGVAVLGGIAAAVLLRARVARLVPHVLASRAASLSLSDASVATRIEMFRIAWFLFRREPLSGYGGGAWVDLYHSASPVFFVANETHSFLTQVLLEAGPIALLGLLTGVLGVVLLVLGLRRHPGHEAAERFGFAMALFALVGHASFDFDLSYMALALLAWILLAATLTTDPAPQGGEAAACADSRNVRSLERARQRRPRAPSRRFVPAAGPVVGLVLALVAIVASGDLALSRADLGAAQVALIRGRPAVARTMARRSLRLDPWAVAADTVLARTAPDPTARLEADRAAVAVAPYASSEWAAYIAALTSSGRLREALAASQSGLWVGAWNAATVLAAARADVAALRSRAYRSQGAFDLASLTAQIQAEGSNLTVPLGFPVPATVVRADLQAALGEGEILSGEPASGADALTLAQSEDAALAPSLAPWLARAARTLDQPALAATAAAWAKAAAHAG